MGLFIFQLQFHFKRLNQLWLFSLLYWMLTLLEMLPGIVQQMNGIWYWYTC